MTFPTLEGVLSAGILSLNKVAVLYYRGVSDIVMPFYTTDSSSKNEVTRGGFRSIRRLYRTFTHKKKPNATEEPSRFSQVTEETTESKSVMIEDIVNSIEVSLKSKEQEAKVDSSSRPLDYLYTPSHSHISTEVTNDARLGTDPKGAKRVKKLQETDNSRGSSQKKMSQMKGRSSKKGRYTSDKFGIKSQNIRTQRSEVIKSNLSSVIKERHQKQDSPLPIKEGDKQSRTLRRRVANEYPGNIKSPTFDKLKELSHALKKLKRFEEKTYSEENGEIALFAPRKLTDEEIDSLIRSSKVSPCKAASNDRIEDVLDKFTYLFKYLRSEANAPLRLKIVEVGSEMRQFADILINSSSRLDEIFRSEQAQDQRNEALDSVCSNATVAFIEISLKWAEEALEIEDSLEQCKLLHDKTTRAYIAFYTWHCVMKLTPGESKDFHKFYGATYYRKSSTRLLERDYYTLLNDCLAELREGLNYLLEKRSQLIK